MIIAVVIVVVIVVSMIGSGKQRGLHDAADLACTSRARISRGRGGSVGLWLKTSDVCM